MADAFADRFEQKISRIPFAGCWLWIAALDQRGYGKVAIGGGKCDRAHRVAWQMARGPIPDGMCVLHACDTPACVNPAHLFLGTRQDNAADMGRKGRGLRKLSQDDIREIRTAPGTIVAIGERFGISFAMVSMIKSGKEGRYA